MVTKRHCGRIGSFFLGELKVHAKCVFRNGLHYRFFCQCSDIGSSVRHHKSLKKIESQNCARKPNSVFAFLHKAEERRQSFICAAHPKTLSQRLIRRATFQARCQRHMPTPSYIALHQGGLPRVCIATNEGGLLPHRFTLTPL